MKSKKQAYELGSNVDIDHVCLTLTPQRHVVSAEGLRFKSGSDQHSFWLSGESMGEGGDPGGSGGYGKRSKVEPQNHPRNVTANRHR